MSVIYPREASILASVCAIIFCIIGVIGNAVTILALVRCPKLRVHATTAFVLSLCVSDLIFCAVNLPITATRYIQEKWTLGDHLCVLFPVLFYGNVIVSVLNMVAITINRYVLISCNRLYNTLYSRTAINVQLFAIWSISFMIMLPPLLGIWGQLGIDPATFSCTILDKDNSSPKAMIFLVGFCFPCIVIILSYSCIYCRVQKTRKRIEIHTCATAKEKRNKRREKDDRRLTKLMLIIFIFFLLSFLPLMIMNVFDKDIKYPFLHVLSSILAWMASVINPFIYAASNIQYREAYGKLFHLVKNTVNFSESRHISDGTNTMKSAQSGNQVYQHVPNRLTIED